ncbi:MAG: ComF family protein [Flavobacteriaceae bacterium]|tara:strand:+ start:700 stop:1404 length:705 start_codon:yes stop_codon:yes gene_type:complete
MKNLVLPSLRSFAAIFFPKLCPGCMNPLHETERVICWVCQLSLPQTDHPWDFQNELWEKMNQFGRVERVVSLFDFHKNSRVQSLLHQLKYKGQQEIGEFLGNWIAPQIMASKVFSEVDAVLPLPLHPERFQQRGYNQVQKFSDCLAHHLGLPVVNDLVVRKKKTRPLVKMKNTDRWEEVDNAFAVKGYQNNTFKHFLLVDDVITTGATLSSCANALLEACGGSISFVALASRLS